MNITFEALFAPLVHRHICSAARMSGPIRIPHPDECFPPLPKLRPRWERRRDRRDAGRRSIPRPMREGWQAPRFAAAPDLGHTRINFTYRNALDTSAGYGEKPGRAQYYEGPHEAALSRLFEMSTKIVDYQFQPLRTTWLTSTSQLVVYSTDVLFECDDGTLGAGEIKANSSYFEEPDTRDMLDLFEAALDGVGVGFARICGNELGGEVGSRTIKDMFDARRTAFAQRDVARAQACIEREDGMAPLGKVVEALGVRWHLALAMTSAMMVQRHIAIDLSRPPMPDSLVTIPGTPTNAGALRRFLRTFSVGAR